LIHPAAMRADGSMEVCARVVVGQRIVMMQAPTQQLVDSVPAVIASALESSKFLPKSSSSRSSSSGTMSPKMSPSTQSRQGGVGASPSTRLKSLENIRSGGQLYGAMVIYCGGMMLRVDAMNRMHEVRVHRHQTSTDTRQAQTLDKHKHHICTTI
jgi:hypothetical protein